MADLTNKQKKQLANTVAEHLQFDDLLGRREYAPSPRWLTEGCAWAIKQVAENHRIAYAIVKDADVAYRECPCKKCR